MNDDLAIVLVGLALGRPQRVDAPDALELSGIDIVMSIDLSGSMRAADLQPTRLEAAKEVVGEFIQRRRSDRMGLVVFGREAFTVVPPTLDYTVLQRMVSALSLDLIDGSGTAIGDGLGTALNRLRHSDARSKVVVLLTDGANNAGHVDPREEERGHPRDGPCGRAVAGDRDPGGQGPSSELHGSPPRDASCAVAIIGRPRSTSETAEARMASESSWAGT